MRFANVMSLLVLCVATGAGSDAVGAIPGTGGTITACYHKTRGTLRVIDTSKTQCSKRELTLTWSQQGPAGTQGTEGQQGPPGQKGDAGPTGQIQGAVAGGDLTGSYPNPTIADGAVTPAKLAPPGAFISMGLVVAGGTCGGLNGWASLSPNVNNEASYYRDPFGMVSLRGIVAKCGTPGDTVFTLPAGYRPARRELQVGFYSNGIGQIDVNPDGTVAASTSPPADTYMSLDGITFRCAPSGADGCP